MIKYILWVCDLPMNETEGRYTKYTKKKLNVKFKKRIIYHTNWLTKKKEKKSESSLLVSNSSESWLNG